MSLAFISILIVANSFSAVQQGHFFLLLNFISAQALFEAGLLYQIMQKSSSLSAIKTGKQDVIHSSIFKAFQYKSLLAITMVSIAYIALISIVAVAMFWRQPDSPSILAIVGLTAAVAGRLVCAAFEYLIEGLGDKAYAVSSRILFSSTNGILLCVLLWLGYSFNSLTIAYIASLILLSSLHIWSSKYKLLNVIKSGYIHRHRFSWRDNMFDTQKRMLVTCIFSFVTLHSAVPIIYALSGPELAGKYGFLLTASTAIRSIALVPLFRLSPDFGRLITQNKIKELRKLIKWLFCESFVYVTAMLGTLFTVLYVVDIPYFGIDEISSKIPSVFSTVCILLTIYVQLIGIIITQLVRAKNIEPFRKSSMAVGFGMIIFVSLSAVSEHPDLLIGVSILMVWLTIGFMYPIKIAVPHLKEMGLLRF